MYTRPKPSDDEDAILKQQEECLKNKSWQPAANVVNKRKSAEGDGDAKKTKSMFASQREASRKKREGQSKESNIVPDIQQTQQVADSRVLGDVVERLDCDIGVVTPMTPSQSGFPSTFTIDKTAMARKGKSIFAQHLEKNTVKSVLKPMDEMSLVTQKHEGSKSIEHSFVLTSPEADELHQENVMKLAAMSSEEILQERERLIAGMDPQLVAFLKSRHAAKLHTQNQCLGSKQDSMGDDQQRDGKHVSIEHHLPGSSAMDVDVEPSDSSATAVEKLNVQLPFSEGEMESFLNMNIVEEEKLQWTADLPPLQTASAADCVAARFDFQGLLLPYADESVPVTLALHHHGDEPSRPGYTLQELLLLGRSNVLQQRVLSLVTIANIVSKTKLGLYDGCFDPPLLEQMLDRELYLFLRFSLDDTSPAVVTAAVFALRNLMCNKIDEVCLDRLLGFGVGLSQPSLRMPRETTKKDEAEMKDHEILRLDLIEGAVRTDILSRLSYILSRLQPDATTVINVLGILTRIARHSYDCAAAVFQSPGLVNTLVENFITARWQPLAGAETLPQSLHGLAVHQAVKLVRVLAARSRSIASDLVHKHGIMDRLAAYMNITLEGEVSGRSEDLMKLNLESFYLWQTFLSYGMTTEHFCQLQPILVPLLRHHLAHTNISSPSFDLDHAAALISLLVTTVTTAHHQELTLTWQRAACLKETIANVLVARHVKDMTELCRVAVPKWLIQAQELGDVSYSASRLLSASIQYATMLCTTHHTRLSFEDVVELLDWIKSFDQRAVQPLLVPGATLSRLLDRVCDSSNLLATGQPAVKRDPDCLPSLGCLPRHGTLLPLLTPDSSLLTVSALTSYFLAAHQFNRALGSESVGLFFQNKSMKKLISSVISTRRFAHTSNYFTLFETCFLARLALLARICRDLHGENFNSYRLAVKLASLLPIGEEQLIRDILQEIVFNANAINQESVVPTVTEVASDKDRLLGEAFTDLPRIFKAYEQHLNLPRHNTLNPPNHDTTNPLFRNNLTVSSFEPALPSDWCYLPLLQLYDTKAKGESATSEQVEIATVCLGWALIGECWDVDGGVDLTARYCRVVTVFLASSDLFLDVRIKAYLRAILQQLLRDPTKFNFSAEIPGLSSFYDLYTQLLEQYAGVSYGDAGFTQYLLVPLQQAQDISFRRQVWSEHAAILRVASLPEAELLLPLRCLLHPAEQDAQMLATYFQCLVRGQVTARWSPILYKVALHHVATLLFEPQQEASLLKLQTGLKEGLTAVSNTSLAGALTSYYESQTKLDITA